MRHSTSFATMKRLFVFPTALGKRNCRGTYTVKCARKGLRQTRIVRQGNGLRFIGQCIGDREGILPTSAPCIVMAPSKEVTKEFIKKRAIGRFVERVVLYVGHDCLRCVISETADQPSVTDRRRFDVISGFKP